MSGCPRKLPGLDGETRADPYDYLATMRATEPVYRDDEYGAYVLTRYDDVLFAERHPELFSSLPAGIGPFPLPGYTTTEATNLANRIIGTEVRTLLNNDPPRHTPYRKLISRLMSRRRVDSHEHEIRAAAHHLLDQVTDREFNLAQSYTRALPVITICRELSLPVGFEDEFLGWGQAQKQAFGNPEVVGALIGMARDGNLPNPVADHFSARIAELRQEPQDDLLSELIHTPLEDGLGGQRCLNEDELLSFVAHFLVAGHDTTTATMNNVLLALMRDEELFTRVRGDLSLVPPLIEEALRHDCPVQGLYRVTVEDVTVGDTLIPADSMVLLSYAAANRDPSHFPEPDAFDPFRDGASAHVAFGAGAHFCVGAYLARLQARIGLEVAVTRLAGLRLEPAGQDFNRISSVILRGVESLRVAVDAIHPASAVTAS